MSGKAIITPNLLLRAEAYLIDEPKVRGPRYTFCLIYYTINTKSHAKGNKELRH